MSEQHSNSHPWSRFALLIGILAFIVILFWPSFASIVELWDTSDHRHGLLVLPISAFLAWRLKHELANTPVRADFRGLLLVVPLLVVWIAARLGGVQLVEHFVVLALIPAAVLTFLGHSIVRTLLFPLFFILFATPVTDTLVPHLMVSTANIATVLLELSAIPFYRQGQYISLPGGEFVVADVCSGVRYLVAGVMIASLYGYLTYESFRKRLVLVGVTALALILANGLRAYMVMSIASATDMRYLGGRDHIYFGWLLFGIVMMILMWVGTRYTDYVEATQTSEVHHKLSEMAPSALPLIAALGLIMLAVTVKPLQADFGAITALLVVVGALLIFVVLVARHRHISGKVHVGDSAPQISHSWREGVTVGIGILLLIWTPRYVAAVEQNVIQGVTDVNLEALVKCPVVGPWDAPWRPQFDTADTNTGQAFVCADGVVNVYAASYATARQGRELISSSNYPVPTSWDRISAASNVQAGLDSESPWQVRQVRVEAQNYSALIWYWYEVGGSRTSSSTWTKLLQVKALASGEPSGGRIILIETHLAPDNGSAESRLDSVARAIVAGPQ